MSSKIRIAVILFLLAGLIFSIGKHCYQRDQSGNYRLPDTNKLPNDYKDLIIDTSGFEVINVENNTVRSPIAFCLLSKKFPVVIYRVAVSTPKKVNEIVNVSSEEESLENGETYQVFPNRLLLPIQTKAIPEKCEKDKIFFSLYGDSIQVMERNDSLISYSLVLKSFSMRYEQTSFIDIYYTPNGDPSFKDKEPAKASILFIKKENAVYFLLLMASDKKETPPKSLLYNLIKPKAKS